jgi:hypothetical protein
LVLFILFFSPFIINKIALSTEISLEISVSIIENDILGPGDTFHSIIEIRNREANGRIDVIVIYDILDMNEHIILSDCKTVAIETKSSFAEEFILPYSIKEGTYLLRANVSTLDRDNWSIASQSFQVFVITESQQRLVEYLLAGGLLFACVGLIFEHRRISKLKVSGRDLKRFISEQKNK